MREISHKKLKRLARKMRTQEEIKDRVPIFQSKAWNENKKEKKEKKETVSFKPNLTNLHKNKSMTKFQLALKSRTTWMIVGMFVIGGIQNIMPFIPEIFVGTIQTLLGLAAIYFKINPSQKYD